MLGTASIVAFIPVRDMGVAEEFYCGRLGATVVERGQYALVIDANGTSIRCVLTPDFSAQPFTILGWEVASIRAAAHQLRAAGIEMLRYPYFEQDEYAVWTAPGGGAQVAWFHDPFGNVLSLSQHEPVERQS